MEINGFEVSCKAFRRIKADESGTGWIAHSDRGTSDGMESLGVAASSATSSGPNDGDWAGLQASGIVLCGEARKLDAADVIVSTRGATIVNCEIIGTIDGRPVHVEGRGDAPVMECVEKLAAALGVAA